MVDSTSEYYDSSSTTVSSYQRDWMKNVSNSKLLSELSIAGTHNSPSDRVSDLLMKNMGALSGKISYCSARDGSQIPRCARKKMH